MEEFFKQFDFPLSDFFKQYAVKQVMLNREYQAAKKDLETNPKYTEFFSGFHPDSIPAFIHKIADVKARNTVQGNILKKLQTERVLDPKARAEEGLWEIQQKKLFTMQCLWRAEKIEIPEIKVSRDFHYWEKNIKECPFLEPVTEDEVELYISYILTDDFVFDFEPFHSFQDYESFKEEYLSQDEAGEIPEWYLFYDIRKGTGSYLILPDVRGKKEQKYLDAFSANDKKVQAIAAAAAPAPLPPKRMDYMQIMELVMEFAEQNEDELTYKYITQVSMYCEAKREAEAEGREVGDFESHDPEVGQARHALSELEYTPFKIPTAAYYDWKQGIINALYKYETQQVADAMKLAFEDYNMRREMGIPFESKDMDRLYKGWEKNMEVWRERILTGRELLGEPRDFNF